MKRIIIFILMFMFSISFVNAGIGFDSITEGPIENPGSSSTFSHTVTGNDRILFVGTVGSNGVSDLVTGVTYNGVALTKFGSSQKSSSDRWISLWYLIAPDTGTNNVIVTASSPDILKGFAVSYTGVDQSNPFDINNTYSAASTSSISNGLTTTIDNAWALWYLRDSNGGLTYTSTSSDSVRLNVGGGGTTFIDTNSNITPAGLNTMSATISSTTSLDSYMFTIVPVQPINPVIGIDDISLVNNSYYNTNIPIQLNLSVTNTNENVNSSYLLNGNLTQFGTNTLQPNGTIDISSLSDGIYDIKFIIENNETQTNSSNITITIDTTNPSVEYIANGTEFNEYSINMSNLFNVTDTNLDTCTINITDYENVTNPDTSLINCTDTFAFVHAGLHQLAVNATDLAGNYNDTTIVNISVNPLINVFFNDTQNSTIVVGYSSTIYHPDGRITTGEVSANGATLLSPVNNGSLDLGLHTIEFSKLGYTTTNVSVLVNATNAGINKTFNVTRAAVNVNIYDKNDFSLITGTNFSLEFVGPTGFTTSTTTGTTSIDGIFAPGTYRLIVSNVDYTTETVFFTFANNEQLNVSVYMDNVSTAGFVVIEVINPNGQPLSSVLVQALQWDSSSSSFIEVAEQNTAANGKGTLNIIVNTKLYKFKATKNGVSVESPQQTISSADSGSTITLTLNLEEQDQSGFLLENIIYNATESFNNNTNISSVTFSWTNTLGTDITGCINTYRIQNNNEILLGGEQCTTSDTVEIQRNVLINGTYDYVIKAEFKDDNGDFIVAARFLKYRDLHLFKQLEDYKIHYFILVFLNIVSIFVGLQLQSILIGTIGLIISSLLAIVIAPTLMTTGVALFSLFVGIIIILGGSNK